MIRVQNENEEVCAGRCIHLYCDCLSTSGG